MNTKTSDIRKAFLDFFGRNSHAVLPSSSLVPHNDPTLMFTAAGMVQFKNVFTGLEKLPSPRAATSQKCVRAGGKHNDLDNVGYTARHHTFFEMLGNFSFGDYFKEEAIHMAWELLTKDYGLSPDRLCVTVYHDDDFAWNTWKKLTGFADHKIIRINSSDNFWSAGDTGPCGPCSEIFYDHGAHIAGGPPGSADQDGDRFTEIWNLVFMQYDQTENGRINLPKPSIDTGMGLERLSAVMQGVHDNYEIDLFRYIISGIKEQVAAVGGNPSIDTAPYKVIADHLRSSCFLIADGVLPSNEGRGYVLRRIMRRAMRYAHQLGCNEPLMYKLVPALITEMGGHYPELGRAQATITENLRAEEERFKETLGRGLKLLDEEVHKLKSFFPDKGGTVHKKVLGGDIAFKLYDTYGFPVDLTEDILRVQHINLDMDGFEKCMEQQRDMARASHKGSGDVATSKVWFEIKEAVGCTKFEGYEKTKENATVLAIVLDGQQVFTAKQGESVYIVLDQTPFYGESGGQVGDKGYFLLNESARQVGGDVTKLCDIEDTQKPLDDFIVHKTTPLLRDLNIGDKIFAEVDNTRRTRIRSNHSATHLLHKALRDALGEHVTQKGSLVNDEKLRFDFSHGKAVTKEEIAAVESVINSVIARGGEVSCKVMSPDAAIAAGAMALFGEKYGDEVRVLAMGDSGGKAYSTELCGGIHVLNVSDIGLFKVTSEGSVASGIRRIEATTGEAVRAYMLSEIEKVPLSSSDLIRGSIEQIRSAAIQNLPTLFANITAELQAALEAQAEANKKRAKEEAESKKREAMAAANQDVHVEKIGALNFIGKSFDGLDAKELRSIAEMYLAQADVVAVATNVEGKASVVVAVAKAHTGTISAVTLVQKAVEILGGKGGGGKPDMAQGGGPEAAKINEIFIQIKILIQ